jgi:predicted nucleic-acid-binding Zn-ribbon protein
MMMVMMNMMCMIMMHGGDVMWSNGKVLEFYGNDNVTTNLQNILNILLRGFATLLGGREIVELIGGIKEILANIIEVAENREYSPITLKCKYSEILQKVEALMFDTFRKMISNDQTNLLERCFDWILHIFNMSSKDNHQKFHVDLQVLIDDLQYEHQINGFFEDIQKLDEQAFRIAQDRLKKDIKFSKSVQSCSGKASNSSLNYNNSNNKSREDKVVDFRALTQSMDLIDFQFTESDQESFCSLNDSVFDILRTKKRVSPPLHFVPTLTEKFCLMVSNNLFQ